MTEEQKEKIRRYIDGLDGISYKEWLKVQSHVDWHFQSKQKEFEATQTLDAGSIPYKLVNLLLPG